MKKIKKSLSSIYVYILIFLIVFSFIFIIILNKKAMPVIMSYASVQTKRVGIEILRSVGTEDINKLINGQDVFTVIKNNNGEIESIDFNTTLINNALIIISKNVRARLKKWKKEKICQKNFILMALIKN